jgi:Undecaprenyl-phosphate galactose phosphotransferase WbaP
MGLYPGYGLDPVQQLKRHTNAVLATGGTIAVLATAFQFGDALSRMLLALGLFGLLLFPPLTRHAVKVALRRLGLWGKPVVIMGSGEVGERTTRLLQDEWEFGYNPVAMLDFRLQEDTGIRLAHPVEHDDYQEEDMPLQALELDRRRGVDTVLFAMPHVRREQLSNLVGWASVNFRHVLIMPNLAGMTNSAVTARDLAGNVALEVKYNLLDPWALRLKRALDVLLTVLGGVVILPLLAVLGLLVYLDSPGGKVFYKDKRMGRNNQLFACVKFRTMIPNAEDRLQRLLDDDPDAREEYELYHKLHDDPRVTRVGGFLRKTSLDELPQLWNVLRGEMSLVGPRPYLPRESEDIGGTQNEILRVPPGITGPWQVSGRASTSFGDRVHMDAYYVRDWSVWLDILLLARTVRSVLLSRGAY